ncbi:MULTISPECIES: ATP-binding cassette domain-containing protein [Microbacterium]|uniref:ATP-binding cassette domain-containing protein n=1 Tax=Microbacterium TaxID=33882 RepID=UPI000C2C413A|nr:MULTISPECIES: ATP-binding cassette domain-containing protein [Microbacterium]MDO8384725.1 ATP-binding cassette domain-containing protein [Microbacterium sp.]
MSLTTTQRQDERDTRVADAEPILRVQNLKVHLPTGDRTEVEAVSNVSITVHDGERVGIVGESGSGKSVTGRAISGLLPGSPRVRAAGSIRFAGREMNGASAEAWAEALLVSGIYPLRRISEAYADLQKLHSRGKVLLGTNMVSSFRTLKARDVHEAAG